ncbi:DNA polymerase sigma subunit [Galdieria sulphuraria]|uniref:polynucleotide adenylyltransferase n=1 Tax=Galdieria sulphuraria TaxID=130081 RepID=M2X292_GALSU|nr:DNA polymerase sigma subunit [Galdieria sulphuraria]EME30495.1 DNA polymerase sigma subunit [Galdieria sulphuraria]|eukprot:XP_005707015.1 DNA polymerase sigma subunit [Galdieria sulphuraria]
MDAWLVGEETQPTLGAQTIRTILSQYRKKETKEMVHKHLDDFIPLDSRTDHSLSETHSQWDESNELDKDDSFVFPCWIVNKGTKERIKRAEHPIIALHYEILELERFVSGTREETKQRKQLIERVTEIIRQIWPNSSVHVFGSFATNLYLPTSDIDLCILSSPENGSKRELHLLADVLRRKTNKMRRVMAIDKARVPIIKVTDRETGIQCDISFGRTNGIENVRHIQKYLKRYPSLRPLMMVIKCFLHQRALNEVHEGGIGSYLLLLSIISHLQMIPVNFPDMRKEGFISNLGSLLLSYFQLYGRLFNYMKTGISVKNGGYYYEKVERFPFEINRPNLLSLEDPRDEENELGRNSFAVSRVRTAFSQGYECLFRWDKSMKCTPLSLILQQDEFLVTRRKMTDLNGEHSKVSRKRQRS